MSMIRTTISLPEELYEEIRKEAFDKRLAFRDVVEKRLKKCSEDETDKDKIKEDLAFFKKIGKKMGKIDVVAEVRKMREER